MPFKKQGNFTFNHSEQQDDLYRVKESTDIKKDFDSRAEELKNTLNVLIDDLKKITAGDSGAKNIGVSTIEGVAGNDIQTVLEKYQQSLAAASQHLSGVDQSVGELDDRLSTVEQKKLQLDEHGYLSSNILYDNPNGRTMNEAMDSLYDLEVGVNSPGGLKDQVEGLKNEFGTVKNEVLNAAESATMSAEEAQTQATFAQEQGEAAKKRLGDLSEVSAVQFKDRQDQFDARLAEKATEYQIDVTKYGAKGDGITDDTQAFKDAIFALDSGQEIYVPRGNYKIHEPLITKKHFKIRGADIDNTVLLFQGTDGIMTTSRTDYLSISDLKIKDELQGQGTIGIKLVEYSSYHRIRNISIEGFGQWGFYQEGGQTYELDTIYTLTNGKNPLSADAEAGSFIITTPTDTSKVTTTGILKNLYARSGGKYGFRLNRSATIKIDVLIVEYHDIAFYADRAAGATLTNYYEEANRSTGQITWTHDANVTFINPRLSEQIKRTYEGLVPLDRKEPFIGRNDMTTRFLEVDQVNLSGSTSRTSAKEGGFRYNNKNAELFTGSGWEALQKVKAQTLSIPSSTTVTYDLGLYDTDRIFELTVAAVNQALSSAERFAYKRILVAQGSLNTGLLQTSILEDVGTLFNISFRENTGHLYLDILGSAISSTVGTVSVKELAGSSYPLTKI
ncbi:glycosyl hydrolase family 28-related protein [Bacillus infantis]|uniref:glycosyl hydrolase family 28-related protein n=1 Tax=Bacillus infantis TaxID=324767 RepID=UPI003CF40949